MKKYTKRDFEEHLYSNGLARMEAKRMVISITSDLADLIACRKAIRLKRLGWAMPIYKAPGRPVRNPKTGEKMTFQGHWTVKLRTGRKMKCEHVNASELETHLIDLGHDPKVVGIFFEKWNAALKEISENTAVMEIRGLFALFQRDRDERIARNPKTGEKVVREAYTKVMLRVSKQVFDRMNGR